MYIYIIRHGETDANKEHILQGSSESTLNESGIKLAIETGKQMKKEGLKFDAIFSSPLSRSRITAELVRDYSGNENIEIINDDRLKEINLGPLEGKRFMPEFGEVDPALTKAFMSNPFLLPPIEGAETARQVCERTRGFLEELATMPYESVLVSTHGCALRGMLNFLYENKEDYWQGRVPYNCCVNILESHIDGGKPHFKFIEEDKVYYDKSLIVDRFIDIMEK